MVAQGAHIRRNTARDMEVVPDVNGTGAVKVRYRIRVFADGMAGETGASIRTAQRERDRDLISV